MKLPEPFRWEGEHIAVDLSGAHALFSTRNGGVSEPPFESLNLGRLTKDPQPNVDENRARLAAAVGIPRERFLYGRQVHGTTVRRATEAPSDARPVAEEDGQATSERGMAALVFVADCLPIALAAAERSGDEGSARGRAVAMLHCGWRPLAGGMIAEGVAALRDLGAHGPVTAAIGPGAKGCCYEVGDEVHAHFADIPEARHGERNLDLPTIARAKLAAAGVDDIHDVGLCTLCNTDLFFSHRAEGGTTGRQAGVAWRA
jgi:purine-nucleoside/S-methyl-5'-thioadenosine phosphorylase / adenosine deaminase